MMLKMNSLVDREMIAKLYEASEAGVKVKMIVRGICSLITGVKGMSDNIEVISIVDKFLEHSRIFLFGNGGDPLVYTGSADWMDRNLSRRVEVVFPIEQPLLKQRLIREILATTMADNTKGRELMPDGSYRRFAVEAGQPRVRSQERFLEMAAQNVLRRMTEEPVAPIPYVKARPTRERRPAKRQTG